ncbi:MAG: hypothetical protein AB1716_00825 [Planctomycetota bacterium]
MLSETDKREFQGLVRQASFLCANYDVSQHTQLRMRGLTSLARVFGEGSHFYRELLSQVWPPAGVTQPVRTSSMTTPEEIAEYAARASAYATARREHLSIMAGIFEAAAQTDPVIAPNNVPAAPTPARELFLPQDVWNHTRGYLEQVCSQLNACVAHEIWDGAAVLMRRLVETLIIEAYEHLRRENEIKGSDGNFLMLRDLVARAVGSGGLSLGREARGGLPAIKDVGDRSAHNRRYNARRADIFDIRAALRVAVDELIALAELRHA